MWLFSREPSRAFAAAVVAAALASSSCGYALAGSGSFLPASIRIIGIPLFTNTTSYPDIAEILTAQVRTEFIGRGRYRIVPESAGVDALLTGQVTSIVITPVAFTQEQQQASRYLITVRANIELLDVQKDVVLWSDRSLAFREEYDSTSDVDTTDPSAFFGQEAGAVQRVSAEFARAIVSSILEAF